jgi:hypothetical protein
VAALDSRFYLTADGSGRVETSTHPSTGERVWFCFACSDRGEGEDEGRAHAASHTTAARRGMPHLAHDHFN